MAPTSTGPTTDRETMLKLAYAHAAASTGQARQAAAESDELLSLASASPQDPSFALQRDAAERLAALWTVAARDLAILEAVRGLSDPATFGASGAPSAPWYGSTRDLRPEVATRDLSPSQIDGDPE
jgi:hypothetical protein